MTQQRQQIPEDDRIELYLGRVIMPRLSKIESGLDLLNLNLRHTGEQIKCQQEDQEEYNSKVRKHDEILNGNGKEGLVGKSIGFEKWSEKQDRIQWFLFTAIATSLIGVIVSLLLNIK